MRVLVAVVIPFLAFFTIGRPFAGLFCLLLQLTLLGWPLAAFWAVYSTAQYHADKRTERLEKAILKGQSQGSSRIDG